MTDRRRYLDNLKFELVGWDECRTEDQKRARAVGHNASGWPTYGVTMIGLLRLANIEACIDAIIAEGIPGDVIETGVWRGGACIFMRAVLDSYGDDRSVWVADSFQGVCMPDPERYPADAGAPLLGANPLLAISQSTVKDNFRRFGVSLGNVNFVEGWFRDTLPKLAESLAEIGRNLSLLRLDGDLYESTYVALEHLYPRVSPGGFVIVDDYDDIPACKAAIHDYRKRQGIMSTICRIDHGAVYWRKDES